MKGPLGREASHPEPVSIKPLEIRRRSEALLANHRLAYRLYLQNVGLTGGALGISSDYDDSVALLGESQPDD